MYCIKRFLFFFFEGRKDENRAGAPCKKPCLWKIHTHTHSVDVTLVSLNSTHDSVELVPSSQHATRIFCTCINEQRVWHPRVCENTCCDTCQQQLRASVNEERTRLVESTISFFFFLSKSCEFSINAIYSCIIPSSTNNISFEKRNNRDSTVQTTISFLFPFLNIYNIVCRSCVLSLHSQNHVQLTVCVNVRSRFSLASPGGVYFEKTKK